MKYFYTVWRKKDKMNFINLKINAKVTLKYNLFYFFFFFGRSYARHITKTSADFILEIKKRMLFNSILFQSMHFLNYPTLNIILLLNYFIS